MLYNHFRSIVNKCSAFLLPPTCLLCGFLTPQAQNICAACVKDLPSLPQHCPICAQFLPFSTSGICGACLSDIPSFQRTLALFPYEPPIVQMIIKLKFGGQLAFAHAFSQLLFEQISFHWYINQSLPQVLIPIPLHGSRLQERGYNQTLEIARPLSRALGMQLDLTSKRIKATLPQSGLTAAKREQNIRHAFYIPRKFNDLHVAVLDDVITTGQTVREFCKMLKRQGVKQIDIWCCARRG